MPGYEIILDSAWFMEAAHALYHSSGFKEIAPYPESEIPKEIHHLWVCMEKDLATQVGNPFPVPANNSLQLSRPAGGEGRLSCLPDCAII